MATAHLPDMATIAAATADLDPPFAVVDRTALEANADDLVRRAAGVPIRVASKSVRVRSVIEDTVARDGFAGVMTYSLSESNWLADLGMDDLLLAYPTVDAGALRDLVAKEHRTAATTLMVDDPAQLDLIDAAVGTDHPAIRLCIDVDASLRIGRLHVGVRRSPIRTPEQTAAFAREISSRPGFELAGLMFYDAQIAGIPDSSALIRRVKRRSSAELLDRRGTVVEAVRQVAPLSFVNAGGTGSLEVDGADEHVTELTAGSGLFNPGLFDGYDAFTGQAAAMFALAVVRKPTADIATLGCGGYIASGQAAKNRQPTPVWPAGLALIGTEGAGEVQTPVRGKAARGLAIGDRVWMRHAKAGEMCERFDSIAMVGADGRAELVPTYRGEGRNHG